jgi:tetratricopeptide (TPR) repeat protein
MIVGGSAKTRHEIRTACVVATLLALSGCVPDAATNPPPGARAAPQRPAAWYGLGYREMRLAPAPANGGVSAGLRINYIIPGQSADNAGLREGDVIVAIDGSSTTNDQDASRIFATTAATIGSAHTIAFIRDGRRESVTVTLVPRATDEAAVTNDLLRARHAEEEQAARAAPDTTTAIIRYARAFQFLADIQTRNSSDLASVQQKNGEMLVNFSELLRKGAAPPTPSEAERYNQRAIAIMKTATSDEDNDRAALELGRALYDAPWIADLWLNRGLVYEKAGHVESAGADFKHYLILRPGAADAAAVREKLTALELLAEERKPWIRFSGDFPGLGETVRVRGRNLIVRATADRPASSGQRTRAEDPLAHLTIRNGSLQGKWIVRYADADLQRCMGKEAEVDARAAIEDGKLIISVSLPTFARSTCAVIGYNWSVARTYIPADP